MGRCRLTVSKPVLKAPYGFSAGYYSMMKRFPNVLSKSTCAAIPRCPLHIASSALLSAEQEHFSFPCFRVGPVTAVVMSCTQQAGSTRSLLSST